LFDIFFRLDKAATNIIKTCMGLKEKESFLVVYDSKRRKTANIILKKAKQFCRKADKTMTKIPKFNGEEPPKRIADKMKEYDVVVIVTSKSLSHTNARRTASKKGVRIASMPGITLKMMKRTLTADYNKIREISDKINRLYKGKKKLRVVTKKGTDVIFYINKSPFNDVGFYTKKRDFGNLPAGEVGFAPVEGKTEGVIVIDKSMSSIVGKLKKPIRIEVEKGFVKKIDGGKEATKIRRRLKKFKNKKVYNIAEFSIGTNYKAKVTGRTLEDEKVYGTVHVALGDNTSFPGGTTKAPVHLDGVISKPDVFIDNKKIMDNGKLVL